MEQFDLAVTLCRPANGVIKQLFVGVISTGILCKTMTFLQLLPFDLPRKFSGNKSMWMILLWLAANALDQNLLMGSKAKIVGSAVGVLGMRQFRPITIISINMAI